MLPCLWQTGGGATRFLCGEAKVTLARLMRKKGKYWMAILEGKTISRPREKLNKIMVWPFPYAFVKVDLDFDEFLMTYSCNHIHGVAAEIKEELVEFCRLLNIDYKVY